MQDRRSFLASLGASALAAGLGSTVACGRSPREDDAQAAESAGTGGASVAPIGLQLYTLRGEMQKDVAATLARVARVGYKEVEFAGYFGKSPAEIRALLDANGLRAPSAHMPVDAFGSGLAGAIDAAKVMGHEYLILAWLDPKDRRTLDDYRRVAERLNRAATEAERAGLRVAYHNHDFEFAAIDGTLPYDLLLGATEPARVAMEMDLYWITRAGQDPLAYFAKHPGRFQLVHVKDSSGAPDHKMADVGKGTIDFARIFAQRAQAGIRHFIVERDDAEAAGDPFGSIETSYSNLSRLRV